MKNTIARSFKIWFFTNLLGSLLLFFMMGAMGNDDGFEIVTLVTLFGAVFSLPAIFFSGLSIVLLKKLPRDSGMRFGFMLGATLGVIACVVLIVNYYLLERISLDLFLASILLPYMAMAVLTSIYFTRDLIFTGASLSPENTAPAGEEINAFNPSQTIEN
jgi:hypothetical protein